MKAITKKQEEYINILSSYPSTKEKDEQNIQTFLTSKGKGSLKDLTTKEASELIGKLLSYPAEYVFPCGRKSVLHKKEINSYNVIGNLEGCLHACPHEQVGGDVNNCPYWNEEKESMDNR